MLNKKMIFFKILKIKGLFKKNKEKFLRKWQWQQISQYKLKRKS
jgi:hypothetical protein